MQITAKDKDDPTTPNAEIAYSIISQEPALDRHMFRIGKKTGKLYVKEPNLDREVKISAPRHHIELQFTVPLAQISSIPLSLGPTHILV